MSLNGLKHKLTVSRVCMMRIVSIVLAAKESSLESLGGFWHKINLVTTADLLQNPAL